MLIFLRRCQFHCYRYCLNVQNIRKRNDIQGRLLVNLIRTFQLATIRLNSLVSKSFSSKNTDIKKYLDDLTNDYKNENWNKNILAEVINVRSIANLLNKRVELSEGLQCLKDFGKDEELAKIAAKEEAELKNELERINEELLEKIVINMDTVEKYNNIIMEIIPGAGGQEAMIFVKDLSEMYIQYLNYLELSYNIIQADPSEKGLRHFSVLISGDEAFRKVKYEGGVHRVQRVPETDTAGRIHTSTASVAIIPEPTDIEINLDDKDLKIESKRASGAGGQHVNTTDSAIRIVHLPTGIAVTCQNERSQLHNRHIALLKLKTILWEKQMNEQMSFITQLRRKQMGLGQRNEKVRTYNYKQDRITDHRIENGTMYDIQKFMRSGAALEELEARLERDMQEKMFLEIIRKSIKE